MGATQNLAESYSVIDPDNLSDFSNGIFAFAATLLVVSITLPVIPQEHAEAQLPSVLLGLWPSIVAYVLSFMNINSYWKLHSFIFMHIGRIDNKLVLLNTLLLLSTTFLPLPTALMGKYGRFALTNFVYGATLTINHLFLLLTAYYAYKQHLMKEDSPFPAAFLFKKKLVLPLIAAMLGTGFSLFYPHLGFVFYAVVILTHFIPFRHQEAVKN